MSLDLTAIKQEPIDLRFKGFPDARIPIEQVSQQQWNLREGDLGLPVMALRSEAITNNVAVMSEWCLRRGVVLAPHGKTTMAPQLIDLQLDAGAWGITAATMSQLRAFHSWGVGRVLLANQISQSTEVAWLAQIMASDEAFEPIGYVDSIESVELLQAGLSDAGSRTLGVLVELGIQDGRSGARGTDAAMQVVKAVQQSRTLTLSGVAGYEGIIAGSREPSGLVDVDRYLSDLRGFAESVVTDGMIVSAGGSAYFDRVVELLKISPNVELVLRSGCYITHDHGMYERLSPLDDELQPAIELWAAVTSRPQANLALTSFGKRDVSFDVDLPVALRVIDRHGDEREAAGITVAQLNDQHAYLRVEVDKELDVGDRIVFGISHPCTAFDKWRLIAMTDDSDNVVDAVMTFF